MTILTSIFFACMVCAPLAMANDSVDLKVTVTGPKCEEMISKSVANGTASFDGNGYRSFKFNEDAVCYKFDVNLPRIYFHVWNPTDCFCKVNVTVSN